MDNVFVDVHYSKFICAIPCILTRMRAMSSMMDTVKACAKAGNEKDWIKYSPKVFSQDWRGVSSLFLMLALLCVCIRPSLCLSLCLRLRDECAREPTEEKWCLSISAFVHDTYALCALNLQHTHTDGAGRSVLLAGHGLPLKRPSC